MKPCRARALRAPLAALLAALAATATAAAPSPAPDAGRIEALAAPGDRGALARFRELLALPNVAGDEPGMEALSQWLEAAFGARGFQVGRLPMPGHDLLLAERASAGATTTVLVYLQADGQPVDPARWHQDSPWSATLKRPRVDQAGIDGHPERWETLPWEVLRQRAPEPDWRVFARSAADSKGPIAQLLAALAAMDAAGIAPTVNLKLVIDTEEEIGSPHLADAVRRHRDRLAADALLILDGPPHASGRPSLTFGARGIADLTLTVYGPVQPQHSGHWGNVVPNPALRLAQLLASMKDDAGRVLIPGFNDGIAIDAATRRLLQAVPEDREALAQRLLLGSFDQVADTTQEALQYPSLNIRGLSSGWVGEQARTLIPDRAVAELDVRLVAESEPARLLGLVREHVASQGYLVVDAREPTAEERLAHPRVARLDGRVHYGAFRSDPDAPPGRWAAAALERLNGEPPIRVRTFGGSIPIAPFVTTLDLPAVQVGTVNPDNNQHAPNENLRVGDFLRGIRTMMAVLTQPWPADPE